MPVEFAIAVTRDADRRIIRPRAIAAGSAQPGAALDGDLSVGQ